MLNSVLLFRNNSLIAERGSSKSLFIGLTQQKSVVHANQLAAMPRAKTMYTLR